jgi:hypothetical protein
MKDVGMFYPFWSILWSIDIVYAHLAYFVVIWHIFPILVFCTKKNLATMSYVI